MAVRRLHRERNVYFLMSRILIFPYFSSNYIFRNSNYTSNRRLTIFFSSYYLKFGLIRSKEIAYIYSWILLEMNRQILQYSTSMAASSLHRKLTVHLFLFFIIRLILP